MPAYMRQLEIGGAKQVKRTVLNFHVGQNAHELFIRRHRPNHRRLPQGPA